MACHQTGATYIPHLLWIISNRIIPQYICVALIRTCNSFEYPRLYAEQHDNCDHKPTLYFPAKSHKQKSTAVKFIITFSAEDKLVQNTLLCWPAQYGIIFIVIVSFLLYSLGRTLAVFIIYLICPGPRMANMQKKVNQRACSSVDSYGFRTLFNMI